MSTSSRPKQKLKPAFNRGWTPQQKAMMEAIVLPKQLRCYDCSKLTHVSGFSEKQCKDLRYGILTRQVNAAKLGEEAWLRCRKCTGVQPTEMECMLCETVKGYDDFAKNQRRTPDRATCLSCSWEVEHETVIENTAADAYAASQDREVEDDSEWGLYSDGASNAHEDSDLGESEAGGAPLSSYGLSAANLKSLDISTSGRSSRPSGSMTSKIMSGAKSGSMPEVGDMGRLNSWQAMSKKNGGSVADSTSGAQFTGYDPAGGSHQKIRAPSTVSSDDSQETTTADHSYDYRAEKQARSKFAKVPGFGRYVPKPLPQSGRTLPARHHSDDEEIDEEYFTI